MAPKLESQVIPCIYPGETAVMFATGPSLTEEVIEEVRPYHVAGKVRAFGCNDSYKLIDYLDVFYACDGAWWDKHPKVLETLPPECHVWTQEQRVAQALHFNYINGVHKPDLSKKPDLIHYGSNSGYQQLNIAYLYGIRKFLLVGYNMQKVEGKSHFFGDHPSGLSQHSPYDRFVQFFASIDSEIRSTVINCTPNSALKNTFKNQSLTEALECL